MPSLNLFHLPDLLNILIEKWWRQVELYFSWILIEIIFIHKKAIKMLVILIEFDFPGVGVWILFFFVWS